MQHIPEQYPNIVFIRKESKTEIIEVLKRNKYKVIEPVNLKDTYENNVYAGIEESVVLLYQTENFDDSENGLATIEKAFVDIYYAVTRNEYPLALQALKFVEILGKDK